MRRFDYCAPASLEEAVAILAQSNGTGQTVILNGGTDLLVEMKSKLRSPQRLVNIKHIANLNELTYDGQAGLRIGALATVRRLETAVFVREHYPGLASAARQLGSIQIRNRATVAGNICRASPSADTPPPLIAAGAQVRIFGPNGERQLPLEQFFTGPGRSVLDPAEILVQILVPPPPANWGHVYLKHGRRNAMELATVGVAVALRREGNRALDVRIVLGAVAPIPIRVPEAEALLNGQVVDGNVLEGAVAAACEAARPISDVRSSASYRREMVGVLTRRAILQALQEVK